MRKIKLYFDLSDKISEEEENLRVLYYHGIFFCDKSLLKILIPVKINVDGMQNTMTLMV